MGEEKRELKEIILVTANTRIHNGPAILCGVCLSGDGQNVDAQVYDGVNNSGKEILHLEALSGTTFNWEPNCDVRINNGLHVVVNRAEAHVMLTFLPLERHE